MQGNRMNSAEDYYAVLEIPPTENVDDIHKAFRRLAKQCHPDHASAQETGRFRIIQHRNLWGPSCHTGDVRNRWPCIPQWHSGAKPALRVKYFGRKCVSLGDSRSPPFAHPVLRGIDDRRSRLRPALSSQLIERFGLSTANGMWSV